MSTIPPCAGRHELFDSTSYQDHLAARSYCATCPLIRECHQRLQDAHAQAFALKYGGGPSGTWAGQLVGARRKAKTAEALAAEEAEYDEAEARLAHNAWNRGNRSGWAEVGERVYQRRAARRQKGTAA